MQYLGLLEPIAPTNILQITNIKLGWIKRLVRYSGNEAVDVLAKKATQEESPFIPAPETISRVCYKKVHHPLAKEWDNGESEAFITFYQSRTTSTHGKAGNNVRRPRPFPTYSKDSTSEAADSCGCEARTTLVLQVSLLQRSYHLTKTVTDLEPLWWKRVMNNNNSRRKSKTHTSSRKTTTLISKRWRRQLATDPTNPMYSILSSIHRARPSQIQQHNDLKD
ncbi:hypothetical protein AVEN_194251-1 [Araneus ventricosus]|uniref:RNase H type-1 domain-containing protein n=1 Tax=Araneus ventricosus TaxID=182803 RepID=A0A4Y2GIT4_ARAVE|nr:hypothetical protein AVEN_194251-1 [Araneus ventricosus]